MSAGLLALAGVYLAAEEVARARWPAEAAQALATSFAYWALALALAADAVVAAGRALPLELTPQGRLRLTAGSAAAAPLASALGRLLLASAFLAHLAARERLEIRAAAGEEFVGSPEQFISRDTPRSMSPGPFRVRFAVESVQADLASGDGSAGLAVTVRDDSGAERRATRWRPLWFGWGRFLRPVAAGWAPRYELATEGGAVLESAFLKADLLPAGKREQFRLAPPHRIEVAIAPQAAPGSDPPALWVAAYRGRLLVGEGLLKPGEALAFEGRVLRFPEWRRWVTFGMVRDPGIPLAVLGAAAGGVGLWLRRRRSPPAGPPGGAGP